MRFITEFHRIRKLTKGINYTFIALIPKVVSPQRLNDFRSISLVGSMYKVLAKVLVNRCVHSSAVSFMIRSLLLVKGSRSRTVY